LPPGGRVDAVEPSPHDAAKAYIAVLRYQLGDWKPYIYKTEDYGKRWQLLTDGKNGIPSNFPTRVIREDPQREGLLFAGTEYGIFVSSNDGKSWHAFQQNFPVTPITDIKIHRGDLAISTMGRGFWVLDNITTLRQPDFDSLDEESVLFKPMDTVRFRQTFTNKDRDAVPQYPSPAVIIDYFLAGNADKPITLDIVADNGDVVNSYISVTEAVEKEDSSDDGVDQAGHQSEFSAVADKTLSGAAGMHRFRWDMRHTGAWHKDEKKRYKKGPLVRAGHYKVRLTADGDIHEESFVLSADPRLAAQNISGSQVSRQVELELEVVQLLDQARRLEYRLQQKRDALENGESDGEGSVHEEAAIEHLDAILADLKTAKGIYMRPMLTAQISYLYGMISVADQVPGTEAEERFLRLQERFAELVRRADDP
jgi:hypothetical protein